MTNQCIGIVYENLCPVMCKNDVHKVVEDSDLVNSNRFCTLHYKMTRPFYRNYKLITSEALNLYDQVLKTPVTKENESLFKQCYTCLSAVIRKRQRFMKNFVFSAYQDIEHFWFIEKLMVARSYCKECLFSIRFTVSNNPEEVVSSPTEVADPKENINDPEEDNNDVDCSVHKKSAAKKKDKKRRLKFNKYLDRIVQETESEFVVIHKKIDEMRDTLIKNTNALFTNDILPMIKKKLFGFLAETQFERLSFSEYYLKEIRLIHDLLYFSVFESILREYLCLTKNKQLFKRLAKPIKEILSDIEAVVDEVHNSGYDTVCMVSNIERYSVLVFELVKDVNLSKGEVESIFEHVTNHTVIKRALLNLVRHSFSNKICELSMSFSTSLFRDTIYLWENDNTIPDNVRKEICWMVVANPDKIIPVGKTHISYYLSLDQNFLIFYAKIISLFLNNDPEIRNVIFQAVLSLDVVKCIEDYCIEKQIPMEDARNVSEILFDRKMKKQICK